MSMYKFGKNLSNLISSQNKTAEEKKFISQFYKYSPLLRNKCILNILTCYIEDAEIEDRWKIKHDEFDYKVLMSQEDFKPVNKTLSKIKSILSEFHKSYDLVTKNSVLLQDEFGEEYEYENYYDYIMEETEKRLFKEISNVYELVDYLIYCYYKYFNKKTKVLLWRVFGDTILDNIKSKSSKCYIPVDSHDGFDYLGRKCEIKEVNIADI